MPGSAEHKSQKGKLLEEDILIHIAKVANSTLDLREILSRITSIIAERLKKDVCSVYLLKPGQKLSLAATKGLKEEAIDKVCFETGEGVVGWVSEQLKPLAVENISSEPRFKDISITGARDFQSMLAVPILRDNRSLGVITLQTKEPYVYTQEEIDRFTLISHTISASIRNAELYKNVTTQLDELKSIHEIGKAVTSILRLEKLLPFICEEVSRLFNVKGCILRLLEGDNLQIKASHGLPDRIKQEMNLFLGEGIAGHVAKTGSPLLIDDVSQMPDNLRVPVIETTSVLCVPLKIGERTIGTLGLYDKKDEFGITTFTQKDMDTLNTFASASSIAIENARLYRDEVNREKKILSLYWEVIQTKDYLESIIEHSADAIITSDINGMITSWNKSAEIIYGFSEDEALGRFLPMVPSHLIEKEKKFISQLIQKETITNIETERQKKEGDLIEVSLTLSPVIDSSGNVSGICGISRDISEKKRVEKELVRRNQELSRLFFINSIVRSTLDLDKLLRIILTVVTMSDGLGFNRAILFLVDEHQKALTGVMGVGPENPEEAGNIWLSLEGKSLESIVEEIESGPLTKDSYLDKLSQDLTIPLDEGSILSRCVTEKRLFNIPDAARDPLTPSLLIQTLGIQAFGVVPLITMNRVIGVILVDNVFTGNNITEHDLQFLMGFTSHIASAIENARLFEDVSLAQSELKNIFESITDMVYYTDQDFNLISINQAVVNKFKKPFEEIIGKKCFAMFHGSDAPPESCPHARSIRTRKSAVKEVVDSRLGGTFVISSSPLFDSSGAFAGTVNIARDITELRVLRERLNTAERMAALGEMAARVAHEIRNPLISVGGFARRLEKKLTGELHENAMIIVEEVRRLEKILKEILAFVKEPKLSKNTINLNDVINNVINFSIPEIIEKGNTVVKELTETPLMTVIDSDRIKEALLNIISNSNQATESGTITVRTYRENNEAILEISDSGCGIQQDSLKEIFNPFFTTMPHGTGLGLTITNRIIQEHSGRISVESSGGEPGESGLSGKKEGTTFKIFLPLEGS
jgi:PAS domain S-box-containing protein